ncbi:hypothetical protein F503_01196 [Ophiostoma piceae UAMH 11346]|uniref:Uncharacterized protein n=1 Tax=Ophiostoma piceae (strain UAMH 11346) TaxID=1262450 RepID=S3CPC9_OPHP1|nr:hypothetical protein F503_01196 [Ophiostoma piceae UAMH 11346]
MYYKNNMPFFSRNPEPEEELVQTHEDPPTEKRGLFGLRRDLSPTPSAATNGTRHTTNTVPSRHSTETGSITSSLNSGGGSRRSFLHRSFGHGNGKDSDLDPSIIQARERVMGAETAERDADRALDIARREVREAREHAKRLELEAKEEARRAKVKQFHARDISKRAKPLGRHGL